MRVARFITALLSAAMLASFAAGCATTTTSSTTWTEPGGVAYGPRWGQVASVQEVVHRVEGDPAGGAVAGAVIGGLLFGSHGHNPLVGAAGGALVGAAASQGSSMTRTYRILVRFDDGDHGMFVYRDYSPFHPGERVVLTPGGLARP
jgi:outer membrane lipoprotein SlyB